MYPIVSWRQNAWAVSNGRAQVKPNDKAPPEVVKSKLVVYFGCANCFQAENKSNVCTVNPISMLRLFTIRLSSIRWWAL